MIIRCQRCSTTYELDEALLAPAGSPVQCTRCQHVFTAFPPDAARSVAAVAAPPAARAPARERIPPSPPPRAAAETAASGSGATSAGAAAGARPEPARARPAPPPVYRPSPPGPPGVTRAPVLRRDTVGTFEARLRWSARWKWLAPAIAGVAIAAVAAGWTLLSRRADPSLARARSEALALIALDDSASLDEAVARLDEALRRAPKARGTAADRALAQVIRATGLAEDGEAAAARVAALAAERDRLRREQPDGWEDAARAAAADVQALEPEVRARADRARALGSAAIEALRALQRDLGDTPEVSRGIAVYEGALDGDRDRALRSIGATRGRGSPDPWVDLAEAWLDARDRDHAGRERAVQRLSALAAAHPELLRGRYLLARTQVSLGRKGEALATLDKLFAANRRHEAARRLHDELSAPPPPAAAVSPPPALQPAPQPVVAKPAPQPRKLLTHPEAVPGAAPPAPAPPAAAPQPDPAPAGATATSGATPVEATPQPAPPPVAPPQPPVGAADGDAPQPPPPRPERRRVYEPPPDLTGG